MQHTGVMGGFVNNMKKGIVDMSHGSGGRAMAQLIEELFIKHLANELLCQGNDQATFDMAFHIGPNDFKTLESYGLELEEIIPYFDDLSSVDPRAGVG